MTDWHRLTQAQEDLISSSTDEHLVLYHDGGLVRVNRDAYLELVRLATISAMEAAAKMLGLTSRDQINDLDVEAKPDASVIVTMTDFNGRAATASTPAPAAPIGKRI